MSQYIVESDCCSDYIHPSFLCLCKLSYKVLLLANIILFSIKTFVYQSAHFFWFLLHYKYKQLLCFIHKVKYFKTKILTLARDFLFIHPPILLLDFLSLGINTYR